MRPITVILLVVALVIAGATAFFAKRLMDNRADTAATQTVREKEILVATRDITVGKAMVAGDMEWQPWPEDMIDKRYILRDSNRDAIETFTGSTARTGFVVGEPIQSARLFHQGDAGFLAGMLSPGMRAVAIAVKPEAGAGGFLTPGDRVDVILSYSFKRKGSGGISIADSNIWEAGSQTIVRDARVLGVDQKMSGDAAATGVKMKSVTVEVTPEGAEKIALGAAIGALSVALRSLAMADGEDQYPRATTDMDTLMGLRDALVGNTLKKFQAADTPLTQAPPKSVAKPKTVSQPTGSNSVKVYRGGQLTTEQFR